MRMLLQVFFKEEAKQTYKQRSWCEFYMKTETIPSNKGIQWRKLQMNWEQEETIRCLFIFFVYYNFAKQN